MFADAEHHLILNHRLAIKMTVNQFRHPHPPCNLVIFLHGKLQYYTIQLHHHNKHKTNHYLSFRFFEHPLTAATSAMLNISGSGNNNDDDSNANSPGNANVNLGVLGTPHQVHQVHNPNGSTSFVYEYYKVPDKDGLQWRYVKCSIQLE